MESGSLLVSSRTTPINKPTHTCRRRPNMNPITFMHVQTVSYPNTPHTHTHLCMYRQSHTQTYHTLLLFHSPVWNSSLCLDPWQPAASSLSLHSSSEGLPSQVSPPQGLSSDGGPELLLAPVLPVQRQPGPTARAYCGALQVSAETTD